ncbi:MAG TPA: sugar phosphate isomerase/epimerase family protein [Clostridia bacterium]|nr:sugar phosphate isomerase/epimerase family protein [Clostridia bacterium]
MFLATQTQSLSRRFGDERAIALCAAAGFDALDYSMLSYDAASPVFKSGFEAYARRLRACAEERGMFFCQAHAPFDLAPGEDGLASHTAHVTRAVAFAGLLGAGAIAVHPLMHGRGEARLKRNAAFFEKLLPAARDYEIRIAVENLFARNTRSGAFEEGVCSDPREHAQYVDAFGEHFAACLDVGHCRLVGRDPAAAVRALGGERLAALHVHDNDLHEDRHALPYLGGTDWLSFMRALADVGYDGALSFEAHGFLDAFPDELLPEALRLLERSGRQLIGLA